MEVNEILFKELPFRPDYNQVFYIENGYDSNVNNFIRRNYDELKSIFANIGMDFYYLPYLLMEHDIEAKVRYYAPYLSPKLLVSEVRSDALVPFISDPKVRKSLKPSIIFQGTHEGWHGDVRFTQIVLSDIDFTNPGILNHLRSLILESFGKYCQAKKLRRARLFEADSDSNFIQESRSRKLYMPCQSDILSASDELLEFEEEAEEKSFIETENILRELRMTVQRLRLEGVSLMAIHEFIDKQEPLSRMIITPDYRIILPDYNHMEIEMGALPKAIYFLYLRYPEGIVCRYMQDHYTELINIYRQLRPNTDEARLNLTITKVVNPLGNALNENIARIRRAFVEKFDEHLAKNYIITGERSSTYSIPLDRNLITWEE